MKIHWAPWANAKSTRVSKLIFRLTASWKYTHHASERYWWVYWSFSKYHQVLFNCQKTEISMWKCKTTRTTLMNTNLPWTHQTHPLLEMEPLSSHGEPVQSIVSRKIVLHLIKDRYKNEGSQQCTGSVCSQTNSPTNRHASPHAHAAKHMNVHTYADEPTCMHTQVHRACPTLALYFGIHSQTIHLFISKPSWHKISQPSILMYREFGSSMIKRLNYSPFTFLA